MRRWKSELLMSTELLTAKWLGEGPPQGKRTPDVLMSVMEEGIYEAVHHDRRRYFRNCRVAA
jgi:hypothetical protein